MGKIKMSFEESRKAILKNMRTTCKEKPITKVIPFRNDDVPKFLERLAKFEEESKKAHFIVK